jgi:hypothetical protein
VLLIVTNFLEILAVLTELEAAEFVIYLLFTISYQISISESSDSHGSEYGV